MCAFCDLQLGIVAKSQTSATNRRSDCQVPRLGDPLRPDSGIAQGEGYVPCQSRTGVRTQQLEQVTSSGTVLLTQKS